MRYLPFGLLLLCLMPHQVWAQAFCQDTETVPDCQTRVAAKHLKQATNQRNVSRPAAVDTSGGVATSSVKDLVSPISVAVQSVDLDQKQHQLTINFNLPEAIAPTYVALQLQSILQQPQLYAPVQAQVTSTQAQTLNSSLNDLGDASFVLTAGIENQTCGRRLRDNNDIFKALFAAVTGPQEPPGTSTTWCNELVKKATPAGIAEPHFRDFSPPQLRAQVEAACTAAAVEIADRQAQRAQEVKNGGFGKLGDLLNNQPQIVFTFSRRIRNELVGPDTTAAQVSWEWTLGSHNLNGLRRAAGKGGDVTGAFTDIAQNATHVGRFKLSGQYMWVDAWSVARPADTLALSAPRARRLTGSLYKGQPVLFGADGKESGRIDLTGQYDNFSDDPAHKDRLAVALTYTQQVSDNFSLPIGIVYANHAEFLNDVQKKFSAHFALQYKIPFSGS